jgi:hypothetical protein
MEHKAHVHGTSDLNSAHQHHGDASASPFKLASQATLHCLIGCAVGELAGIAVGVSLGFNSWLTMMLATVLGFASGYTLGLWPLVREGKSWLEAFRIIWLGETISITVMELVMNITDYYVGGTHFGNRATTD